MRKCTIPPKVLLLSACSSEPDNSGTSVMRKPAASRLTADSSMAFGSSDAMRHVILLALTAVNLGTQVGRPFYSPDIAT